MLITAYSCDNSVRSENRKERANRLLRDFLHQKIYRWIATQPDSTEVLGWRCVHLADSMDSPRLKFDTYIALTDLYQYYKPDLVKSVQCLTEAMNVFSSEFDRVNEDNPYLFINIGNIFYKLTYFKQARTFYSIASSYGLKRKEWHPAYLGYLNTAFTFKMEQNPDSARRYLAKSTACIINQKDHIVAQNLNLQAELLFDTGKTDSIPFLLNRGLVILDEFKKAEPGMKSKEPNRLQAAWTHMASKTHELLFRWFEQQRSFDSSQVHFLKAMGYASRIKNSESMARLYFLKIFSNNKEMGHDSVLVYADSVTKLIEQTHDLILMQRYSDSLLRYFQRRGLNDMVSKYQQLSSLLADSIEMIKHSKRGNEKELLLASLQAGQAYFDHEGKSMQKDAWRFKIYLWGGVLFSMILLLSISWLGYDRQKRWKKAYGLLNTRFLWYQSHKFLRADRKSNKPENLHFLKEKLEKCMVTDTPFLNPELSIDDLALQLGTNTTYLSRLFNKVYGVPFSDFINRYRVEEACRLLQDPTNRNLSFIHLAERSGFNSKSTFYRAFNKFKGMTPIVYLRTLDSTETSKSFPTTKELADSATSKTNISN